MSRVLAIRCRVGRRLRKLRAELRFRAIGAYNCRYRRRLPRALRRYRMLKRLHRRLAEWLSLMEADFYVFLIRILDSVASVVALPHCYWGDPDDEWARVAISRAV
jgi:hypothetical protein